MSKIAIPRFASTIVLVTGGRAPTAAGNDIEVLMMRRYNGARFMPNMYVFPGGGLEETDHALAKASLTVFSSGSTLTPEQAQDNARNFAGRIAALRELTEETACILGSEGKVRVAGAGSTSSDSNAEAAAMAQELLPLGRWITPEAHKHRYDTFFFGYAVRGVEEGQGATLPQELKLRQQESEASDLVWVQPLKALQEHEDPSSPFTLPPPTFLMLHALYCQRDFKTLAQRWEQLQQQEQYRPQFAHSNYSDAYRTVTPVAQVEKGRAARTRIEEKYFNLAAFTDSSNPSSEKEISNVKTTPIQGPGYYKYPDPLLEQKFVEMTVFSNGQKDANGASQEKKWIEISH